MKLALYIPISYLEASKEEKAKVCNGCGAKAGTKFPDTFWGLCIILACQIHDWMFHEGRTLGDYFFANAIFFWNLTAIIYNESNWFMYWLRLERALKYYIGVLTKQGLNSFFVEGKDKNEDMTITCKGKFIKGLK